MKKTFITLQNIDVLAHALRGNDSPDPCARSVAYFALTGRKGLWLYEDMSAAAVVCRHPNVRGEVLAFPAFGPDAEALMAKLPANAARARVLAATPLCDGREMQEPMLDWRYPVHTLDTRTVAQLEGSHFSRIRQWARKVRRSRIRVRPLKTSYRAEALKGVEIWARNQQQPLSTAEIVAPYERGFDLLSVAGLDVRGVAFEKDGALAGLYIWEHPAAGGVAVGLLAWTDREVKGLADFQHVVMCKLLSSMGVTRLCIGGAETAGLDAFKRKFRPVESLTLRTVVPTQAIRQNAPLAA